MTAKEAAPKLRASGFYWVYHREDKRVTIMRWQDFLRVWRDTHGDQYADDEVWVASIRLECPPSNEGWPKEALDLKVRWE